MIKEGNEASFENMYGKFIEDIKNELKREDIVIENYE